MIQANSALKSSKLKYNALDTYATQETSDTRLAVLRRVQFRTTKDGKPFVRALLEDINGLVVVGRLFDISDKEFGKKLSATVGSLVLITYDTDYFGGSLGLSIKEITKISTEEAALYANMFTGKYDLAEVELKACNALLLTRNFSEELNTFRTTYCNLAPLLTYSDERIQRGLKGYILTIIHRLLLACPNASNEAVVAFLYAIITEFNTNKTVDSYFDDSNMLFIASMMDRRVETAAAHMPVLSAKISEFAALFSERGKVISADSYLLYKTYEVLCEASNIAVVESQLPVQGFCVYKNYTIRRD